MNRRTPCAALLAVSASLTTSLFAAEDDVTVAPVTVTATRAAETANESLSSVSVITRDEIDRSSASGMADLLSREPGVEFTRNGGRGTSTSIFLRGTESDHVLVLIDGVEVGSATTGTASFEDIPLANVERIEIVRGPRSSLYGSRAIGGVIQIFTRDGQGTHVSVGAGSNDLRKAAAGYGARSGGTTFSLNVSAEETEGIDARDNDCTFCADEPDKDGYENQSVNLSASHKVTDAVTVSARAFASDSETEFDGSFQNYSENEQRVLSTRVNAQVMPNWNSRVQLSRSEDNSDIFLDDQPGDTFDTTRDAISWQNELTVGTSQVVSLGVDAESTEVDSNLSFAEDEQDTAGAYAQHQWMGQAWSTEASLRREWYDNFDDPVTGTIALGYRLTPNVQAFTSYGTAFRAPTFNELYYPGFGNPDLEPEESRTFEIGLRGQGGPVSWQTTAYTTEVDELIATVTAPGGGLEPRNVDRARITGVELTVGVTTSKWNGDASLDIKDTEDLDTGAELPRRAQIVVAGSLTRELGDWAVGADVTVRGQRFDDAENDVPLDAYGLIDLHASWDFAREWTSRFKVANVTDTDYQLVDTYNTLGRTFLVELAWRPGSAD